MLKRHEDALLSRLDIVVVGGFALIEWWELYLWYGVKRIDKGIWRDLKTRLLELEHRDDDSILIREGQSGVLLVRADELKPIEDKFATKGN